LIKRLRPLTTLLLVLISVFIAIATVPPLRKGVLEAVGSMLVDDDKVGQADVIVIAADADGAGVLEAADLVKAGLSARVAVFTDSPDATDREFIRRGVPYYNAAAIAEQQLHALGVNDVQQIQRDVAGTNDEGRVLPGWCEEKQYKRIIFVGTRDHSRRTKRVMRRAMKGTSIDIAVRYSRYSDFAPSNWWQSRNSVRITIFELQKLALDYISHPFS
jgi:hypothetical protein